MEPLLAVPITTIVIPMILISIRNILSNKIMAVFRMSPKDVAEIIQGIPQDAFDSIKWIQPVGFETFKRDAEQIAKDMLSLVDNSLKR